MAKFTVKQIVMFSSLVMCCFSASLLAAAFGTEYWFVSDSKWNFYTDPNKVAGNVNFGLFKGTNYFKTNQYRRHTLTVVCLDGKCMYSCADTKENREEQLQMLLNGETENLLKHCERQNVMKDLSSNQLRRDIEDAKEIHLQRILQPALNALATAMDGSKYKGNDELAEEILDDLQTDISDSSNSTVIPPTDGSSSDKLEFMDYGLWVGTIACLSAGLLMAVVGALFAIVNTATTPVEAITGIPGLYLWNGLAALFNMITVILWAVQFHEHLTRNVLLYDANDGWSTEGMEIFGYSFWLVVVAIFVHIANIVIIILGTLEPKKNDRLQAPENKGGIIMLY